MGDFKIFGMKPKVFVGVVLIVCGGLYLTIWRLDSKLESMPGYINAPDPPRTGSVAASTSPSLEFYAVAGSYLKTHNEQGSRVAKAMAGVNDGSSTLGDIQEAMKAAAFVENAGYFGDYKSKLKNIPSSAASTASDIDEIHRLFQAAMTEYLEYWKDQNLAHLSSGALTFKKSIALANRTISVVTEGIKQKPS